MPRYVTEPVLAAGKREKLLQALIEELQHPKGKGEPIVLEDYTPETNSRRIHVIWNRWKECDRRLRSGVILDAYKQVFGEDYRKQITLALGVTGIEAMGIALLPYMVTPSPTRPEEPQDDEYEKVMRASGAGIFFVDDRLQLRFARIEDAEATIEFLQEQLPHSKWLLMKETFAADD